MVSASALINYFAPRIHKLLREGTHRRGPARTGSVARGGRPGSLEVRWAPGEFWVSPLRVGVTDAQREQIRGIAKTHEPEFREILNPPSRGARGTERASRHRRTSCTEAAIRGEER